MASILLDGVTVELDGVPVVRGLTLYVDDGELLAVIGPSGSGKSTILRTVAGFAPPVRGDILIGGKVVTGRDPSKRDIAMVFEEDSLIPFLSARRNVAFPLELRRLRRREIDRRVTAEARTLALERFLDRLPHELAAGHQQLVQAARSLVRKPSVFLLDEPLAHMDADNRRRVRTELRLLQQGYGVTTMYATNDQEEAMAIADRIAVIADGGIRQIDTPLTVYREPADTFVAGFVGSPPMSFLPGAVAGGIVRVAGTSLGAAPGIPDGPTTVGVRAHAWHRVGTGGIVATVTATEHHGDHIVATVAAGGGEATVRFDDDPPASGAEVRLGADRVHLFDGSGQAVAHVDIDGRT